MTTSRRERMQRRTKRQAERGKEFIPTPEELEEMKRKAKERNQNDESE